MSSIMNYLGKKAKRDLRAGKFSYNAISFWVTMRKRILPKCLTDRLIDKVVDWLLDEAHAAEFYRYRVQEFDKLARHMPEPWKTLSFDIIANGQPRSCWNDTELIKSPLDSRGNERKDKDDENVL